ncbi:MAG: ThuA domain-containing protein [Verrucomicrobia bacterium]|nr:ThuA domain-containing protein [Verrucomicrobiota bacterium]
MLHRIAFIVFATLLSSPAARAADSSKPLRALLITGGCCHNYTFQSQTLTNGVAKHAKVEWKIVNEGGTGTRAEIPLYDDPNWAKGFDVVVHNECFADTKSSDYMRKITSVHKAGTPAVVIHCAMHTYRSAEIDDWREFLGVTSRRHDHQSNYAVKKVAEHPILKGIPDNWVTAKDELYIIDELWPNAKALATSKSEVDGKDHPVAWVNQYGKARVFGTTYGHSDDTFRDPVFLDLVSRGLLWSAGRIKD